VERTAPAAPTRADNSTERHRKPRANCLESHARIDTTNIHPDQPVPDQPNPDSQVASVFAAVLLSRQRFSWGRLALSAGVAQYFFHSLFVLGAMPFDLGGLGDAHHDHAAVAVGAHGEHVGHDLHAGHGGPWMVLAHVAAAALTTVLVHQGEAIVHRLAAWGVLVLRRFLGRIPQPPVAGVWRSTAFVAA